MSRSTSIVAMLLFSCFLVVGPSARGATLGVVPSTVSNVSLLSAEVVRDMQTGEEEVLIHIRNDGAPVGHTAHLATTVRNSAGAVKRFYTDLVDIRAEAGDEQVASSRLKSGINADDSLRIELVNPAKPELFGVRMDPKAQCISAAPEGLVGSAAPQGFLGLPNVASRNGVTALMDTCQHCSWCEGMVMMFCTNGVKSFSCSCPSGPCDFECMD